MNPLDLDPRFVTEIAVGLEPPEQVALRYNLSQEQWDSLRQNKAFRAAVGARLAELQRGGITAKLKAALLTEALMENLYRHAIQDNTPVSAKLQVAQWLGKIGDLEPKESAKGVGVGAGFQLTIVMPSADTPPQTITIEQPAVEATPELVPEDAPPLLPLESSAA